MIVGEAEIQGQVKRAYEAALGLETAGPLTNHLFSAALQHRQAGPGRDRDRRASAEPAERRGGVGP